YVALAANTIRWQYDIASRVHQDLIAPRALVVHLYAPEADTLVGIALGSGRELWRHTGAAADAPFTRIRKLGHDGERGYLLGDRGLSAFDTATGAILWSNVAIAEGCGFAAAGDRLVVEDPSGGHRVL